MYVQRNVCNVCTAQQCTCAVKRDGEAREIETSRRFRDECNGCENECQGVAPEYSRHAVPILRTWRSPSDLGGLHIRDRNTTSRFITALRVYASSTRRAICIIREVLALYYENAAETISEGLKSKMFRPPLWARYARIKLCAPRISGTFQANFCLRP